MSKLTVHSFEFSPDFRPKPKSWDGRPLRPNSVIQRKMDGWRLTLYKGSNYVKAFGRMPVNLRVDLAHVVEPLFNRMPENTILDGELLPEDATLPASEMPRLIKNRGRMNYCCFAAPLVEGVDLRTAPFDVVKDSISRFNVNLLEWRPLSEVTPEILVNLARLANYEGFVVKEWHWSSWWKVKPQETIDLVVFGTIPGKGKHLNRHGALTCGFSDGTIVASVGKGNDDEWRDDPNVVGRVCEVSHEGWTSDNKLKFSSFVRWRPDKDPRECVK